MRSFKLFISLFCFTVVAHCELESWRRYRDCGTDLVQEEGTISSPGYPFRYRNELHCFWVISSPSKRKIVFKFTFLDTEKGESTGTCYDFVEIYEGNVHKEPVRLVSKHCGSIIPEEDIVVNAEFATVKFKSDDSFPRTGFHLKFNSGAGAVSCYSTLTGENGSFSSPGEPVYKNLQHCTWLITVTRNNKIHLKFDYFELEGGEPCINDYLEVYSAEENRNNSLGRFCGAPGVLPEIIVDSNRALVTFTSDDSAAYKGFNLKWQKIGCSQEFSSRFGVFSVNITNHSHCLLWITVSTEGVIEANFKDVHLQETANCHTESIEVFDGHNSSSIPLSRFCPDMKNENDSIILTSSSNKMLIRARSSLENPGRFLVHYFEKRGHFTREVLAPEGAIMSPNYPLDAPTSSEATWLINVGNNQNLTLIIHDLQTGEESCENGTSSFGLYIPRRPDSSTTLLEIMFLSCFENTSETEFHTSSSVQIRFTPLPNSQSKFYLSFKIGCGTTINATEGGSIVSNDAVPSCHWTLQAEDPGERVAVVIMDISVTQEHPGFLKVHEVFPTKTDCIGTYPGNPLALTVTSLSNVALIEAKNVSFVLAFRTVPAGCH